MLSRLARYSSIAALSACSSLGRRPKIITDAQGVQWSCAANGNAAENMAAVIADWATTQARDSSSATAFRAAYRLSSPSDIAIIRDPALCARAGRAYAHGDSILPSHYHVAVVRVGQRYIAINVNNIRKAGEFLLEAVLDSDFRFVEWIGT